MDSAARDLGLFMAVCLGHFDHFAKGSGSKFPALGKTQPCLLFWAIDSEFWCYKPVSTTSSLRLPEDIQGGEWHGQVRNNLCSFRCLGQISFNNLGCTTSYLIYIYIFIILYIYIQYNQLFYHYPWKCCSFTKICHFMSLPTSISANQVCRSPFSCEWIRLTRRTAKFDSIFFRLRGGAKTGGRAMTSSGETHRWWMK